MKEKKIIIFLYNRFFDPVVQSNFWLFITHLLRESNSGIKFHLISYENEKNLLLNKFMKDCISDFIIWNESPDKQNMIGELLVYVKKE